MGKNIFKDFIYLFLGRGEGRENDRERNIDVWEKHQFIASCMPQQGTWSATQTSAVTGNWTGNLLVCKPAFNPLSHSSQGRKQYFTKKSGIVI